MRIQLLLTCLLFSFHGITQDHCTIQIGQNHVKFKFIDSNGEKDMNLVSDVRYSYGVSHAVKLPVKAIKSDLLLRMEMGNKNWGATSLFNMQQIIWQLKYLDMNISAGYLYDGFYKNGKLLLYAGPSIYVSKLYSASQVMGGNYYDLLTNKNIKSLDYGAGIFGGGLYELTERFGMTLEFRKFFGLNQLERNETATDQQLFNSVFSIHAGLTISFPTLLKKSVAPQIVE